MAYDIRKTNGTVFVTVEDGTLDKTTTSIKFIGKRYPEYGLILNENDLHQLENFSNPTPPINPVIGQMWFDNTPSIEGLKVFTGGTAGWRGLGFSEKFSDTSIGDNLIFSGSVQSNVGLYANEYGAGLSPASLLDKVAIYGAEMDGLDSNTVLYLNFAGIDGATAVTDLAPGTLINGGAGPNNSILFVGTAAIDVFRTRLANGSLLLDGNSDYLVITDNTNYDFGTAPFVMDGWFYTEATSTEQVIMAKGSATTDRWEVFLSATNTLSFEYNDSVDTISIAGGLVTQFRWYHWALERITSTTNSIFTLYLDGQRVATATVVLASYDFDDITGNVIIGRRGYGTFEYFNGNMDEIRVEATTAKYNGGFRPRMITNNNNDGLFYKNSAGQEFRTTFETNNW